MTDLFAWAEEKARGTCGACPHMSGPPVGQGVRYCDRLCVWVRSDWPRMCKQKEAD